MKISVIGLGYVGLPLALEFAKHFPVIGFDIREDRIKMTFRLKLRKMDRVLTVQSSLKVKKLNSVMVLPTFIQLAIRKYSRIKDLVLKMQKNRSRQFMLYEMQNP